MMRMIIFACFVAVVDAACLNANTAGIEMKPGDIAVGVQEVDWSSASTSCHNIHGQLINIKDQTIYDAAVNCGDEILPSLDFAWTGGKNDTGTPTWSDGEVIDKFLCSKKGKSTRVSLQDTGKKNDGVCLGTDFVDSAQINFICEYKA